MQEEMTMGATMEPPESAKDDMFPQGAAVDIEAGESAIDTEDQPDRVNLATNDELVKKAVAKVNEYYLNHRAARYPYEEIWKLADDMWKCGQNIQIRERERQRVDSQSQVDGASDMTKTKAQRKGATLFFRQVRTITSSIMAVLRSKPDPYEYVPIQDCEAFISEQQAYDLAEQHNLLDRWSRKRDRFDSKAFEIIHSVVKYGNYPICVGWNRRIARRVDRHPIYAQDPQTGEPAIMGYEFRDEPKIVDNQPTLGAIPIENMWADPSVGDIQRQSCIVVDDYLPKPQIVSRETMDGFYVNTDKITDAHKWSGARDDNQIQEQRSLSAGLTHDPNRANTGLYKHSDVYVELPIDDAGVWDDKNPLVRYWLTLVGGLENPVCVRFERNPDPDDEWPIRMLHCMPDDGDKLYHFSYSQALRGDFEEQSTTRQQLIDNRTLQNNRPAIGIQGEVFSKDLRYGKDRVIWCEKKDSLTYQDTPDMTQFGLSHLGYFDDDANRTAGTDKPMIGEYAGARTSATESQIVSQNSAQPQLMLANYLLTDFLTFHAVKCLRLWHIYGDNRQILALTHKNQPRKINPAELFGEFDVEVSLVDDYERDALTIQNVSGAAQTLIPLFQSVLDMPKVAEDVFGKIFKMDVARWIKPDQNRDAIQLARAESRMMIDAGVFVEPHLGENHEAHLSQHDQEEVKWRGAEETNPNYLLLKRHIEQTKVLQQQEAFASTQNVPAMTGNQTAGEASGNAMAAQFGGMGNAPT